MSRWSLTRVNKSHTILGSRSQRGLTQLALDVLFRAIANNVADIDADTDGVLQNSVKSSDVSEATISGAPVFIEAIYGDSSAQQRSPTRSQQSQNVRERELPSVPVYSASSCSYSGPPELEDEFHPSMSTPKGVRMVCKEDYTVSSPLTPEQFRYGATASSRGNAYHSAVNPQNISPSKSKHYMSVTASAKHRKRSAKTPFFKGDQIVPPTPRRQLQRPSALPQVPDISTVNAPCDPAAEYIVLVSMYEVYNDRIFDLLTPPVQSAATKEFRRRPLLFKPTELSPDRKVVAGLRKIICSTLSQALMVIEAGLHERRVAGTSSNSLSSRSHGFFSIEVKKRKKTNSKRIQYPWTGNALTIVDLAGSERARDAKTAGTTLAEAGKINESLMYLGQCLQMQSDLGSSNKVWKLMTLYNSTNLVLTLFQSSGVPFRQCKLTELLFSNSFPSASAHNQSQSIRRNPQKGVMIVTADPQGDFNATSQILRYSALAREIAVPRIPSITETILQTCSTHPSGPDPSDNQRPVLSPTHSFQHRPPFLPPGAEARSPNAPRSFSPVSTVSSEGRAVMEHAALEVARLAEENGCLREALEREQNKRLNAEAHLLSMQDRIIDLEQAVREDCVAEFEQRLVVELSRWKEARQSAIERGEEHWDRKMEVFQRSLADVPAPVSEDRYRASEDKENVLVESLEEEIERLRRELGILKRELAGRSPSKRVPLIDREDFLASANGSPRSARSRQLSRSVCGENAQADIVHRRLEDLTLGGSANSSRASSKSRADGATTPMKKVRKLGTRKWEGGLEGLEDPF